MTTNKAWVSSTSSLASVVVWQTNGIIKPWSEQNCVPPIAWAPRDTLSRASGGWEGWRTHACWYRSVVLSVIYIFCHFPLHYPLGSLCMPSHLYCVSGNLQNDSWCQDRYIDAVGPLVLVYSVLHLLPYYIFKSNTIFHTAPCQCRLRR